VMAEFLIQVKYSKGIGQKWSNVWRVDAADLFTAAAAASGTLVPDLLPLLNVACLIDSVLTRDPSIPGSFITEAIGLPGTSDPGGNMLPLFNSLKALFPLLSGGRPDLKYFKGFLMEAFQADGTIDPTTLGIVEGLLVTLISDMATAGATLVDNSGQNYSVVTAQAAVQMRQMHRKRRRSV